MDVSGKLAVIPGKAQVNVIIGKGGTLVKLVESEPGHLLLPLDEKFTKNAGEEKNRKLVFCNQNANYYVDGRDTSLPNLEAE